ncbi:hypothetical protein F4818DRAFT_320044 [Hypoxylon cercidicola]|nr:hypothetical protein F4818DRAFT_320044 [Hypoxylon cercidicola]
MPSTGSRSISSSLWLLSDGLTLLSLIFVRYNTRAMWVPSDDVSSSIASTSFLTLDTVPQTRNFAKDPAVPLGLAGKEPEMNIVSASCSKGKKVSGQARIFI